MERETGSNAQSTNHRVEFVYRIATEPVGIHSHSSELTSRGDAGLAVLAKQTAETNGPLDLAPGLLGGTTTPA